MTDGAILLAGCGNMGGAMLAGWLRGGLDPARFTVLDPALAAVPAGVTLRREPGGGPFATVVLGIKPQALDEAAPALAPLTAGATVISMLAGVRLARLAALFPDAAAHLRVMPNLAAEIGLAPIGLAGAEDPAVSALMAPLGTPEWVDEAQFDLVTALVGSGPAFVYRFLAALSDGATALGMEAEQARRLALATVQGAAALAAGSNDDPGDLARRVTSPGGTTAAGLAVLDADDALARLIAATLRAARDRGSELAG
ncbi:pyrroline-5-carboxylate reductase family protein [Parablastomonas sp. CN1-191]|uniref:pyrroline-5-carboxylate reductase family protein n=1 Tax=Parablastomonas sp. CN1-191 TaxID=3400908 RepID=UPI003BF81D63